MGGRGGTVGWTRNPLRSMLVVSEIALALVALVGAGLFIRSMQNAQRIDPGFESKNLFMFGLDLGARALRRRPRRSNIFAPRSSAPRQCLELNRRPSRPITRLAEDFRALSFPRDRMKLPAIAER